MSISNAIIHIFDDSELQVPLARVETELIQPLDGELQEGTDVVTNVITGSVRQTPTAPGGAAFPRLGGGRQGFPGGGGGGGGG